MKPTLWPELRETSPRTMSDMLYDAAAGLAELSANKLKFYVDAVAAGEMVTQIRYNCFIQVVSGMYRQLLFQVTTPFHQPFEATFGTPEGDSYDSVKNETELRDIIKKIFHRDRTIEIINHLMRIAT